MELSRALRKERWEFGRSPPLRKAFEIANALWKFFSDVCSPVRSGAEEADIISFGRKTEEGDDGREDGREAARDEGRDGTAGGMRRGGRRGGGAGNWRGFKNRASSRARRAGMIIAEISKNWKKIINN